MITASCVIVMVACWFMELGAVLASEKNTAPGPGMGCMYSIFIVLARGSFFFAAFYLGRVYHG
jgi:hypothetical protein